MQILPQALRIFQGEFPRVRVMMHDLSTGEMLSGLRDGKLHVALTVQPGANQLRGLHFDELARYPICVAVPPNHALAKARSVPWTKLANESLIAYSRAEYPEYHEELDTLAKLVGTKPRIAEEHDSVTSVIAAVEAGRGVAFVSSSMQCLAGPRLKMLPFKPAFPPLVVGALYLNPPGALAGQFILAVKQAAKEASPPLLGRRAA